MLADHLNNYASLPAHRRQLNQAVPTHCDVEAVKCLLREIAICRAYRCSPEAIIVNGRSGQPPPSCCTWQAFTAVYSMTCVLRIQRKYETTAEDFSTIIEAVINSRYTDPEWPYYAHWRSTDWLLQSIILPVICIVYATNVSCVVRYSQVLLRCDCKKKLTW